LQTKTSRSPLVVRGNFGRAACSNCLPPFNIPGISTMPKSTLVFAALLIALGAGAFLFSGSRTALLPAYVGLALTILGGLALAFDGGRRHLMHVAAVVALLGALAPAAALFIRAAQMSPLALSVNVGMLVLCAGLLVLMVRSFIAARRAT
jgi:uncharacterized membrane protein HdeD (DUF308 family)